MSHVDSTHDSDFEDFTREEKEEGGPSRHPLLTIWFQPRATLRRILKTDPGYLVPLLTAVWGIHLGIHDPIARGLGEEPSLPALFARETLSGWGRAVVSLYLSGWVWSRVGRWLGGRGDATQLRAAIAWSMTPILGVLLVMGVQFVMMGPELFTEHRPRLKASPNLQLGYRTALAMRMLLLFWSVILRARAEINFPTMACVSA